jgi:hypothetical protein
MKRSSVGLMLGLLLVSCHDGTTTSESLSVKITASDPGHPAARQYISVETTLEKSVNYANSVSGQRRMRSAASGTSYTYPISPDAVSLSLDGRPVDCCPFPWDPATVSDGRHSFYATARYHGTAGSASLDWVLDRRPATFESLGPPPPLGYAGTTPAGDDVAVAIGAAGEPLVLSTNLVDATYRAALGLARWDGGAWEVTLLGTDQSLHPTLTVDGSGTIWAAWDEPAGPTVQRTDGGTWEVVAAGLPSSAHGPRLASAGSTVYLALTDGTFPVRRFEDGGWIPVAPPLEPARVPVAVRLVASDGTPVVALEELDAGLSVLELFQSVNGGPWAPITSGLTLAHGTGGAPERHLIDLVVTRDRDLVVAATGDDAEILVAGVSLPGWYALDYPPLSYFKAFQDESLLPRPPAALAAVPDGGIALIFPSETNAMTVQLWDGFGWDGGSDPLRARVGVAQVISPALVYDSAGRPLAAWQQSNDPSGVTLEVWRP